MRWANALMSNITLKYNLFTLNVWLLNYKKILLYVCIDLSLILIFKPLLTKIILIAMVVLIDTIDCNINGFCPVKCFTCVFKLPNVTAVACLSVCFRSQKS